jgi:GntR family transcriptional regulator, transcriptional repressor for pyruvate dehydrogenase complex
VTQTQKAMFPRLSREPRLSDKVAELLLETILSQGLQPGDRLPSERELGEQFGVSRTVIREAVRALAAKGVIDVRTGSGLRVAAVDAAAVSESMSLYLRGGTLEYGKVHEVRKLLEIEIAALAAERACAEHIERLREICEQMEAAMDEDVEAASLLDLEFHRAIARATDNELYLLLLDSIGEALLEVRRGNLQTGAGTETVRCHWEIFERIAARDSGGARKAMAGHLDHVERHWTESQPAGATP